MAYRILVSAQGPLVLGFGFRGLGPGLDNISKIINIIYGTKQSPILEKKGRMLPY